MNAWRRAVPYLWSVLVVAALVHVLLVRGWAVAVIATGCSVAAYLAALMAHRAEARALSDWRDEWLERYEVELDNYDALVDGLAESPPRSRGRQAVVAALVAQRRAAQPPP